MHPPRFLWGAIFVAPLVGCTCFGLQFNLAPWVSGCKTPLKNSSLEKIIKGQTRKMCVKTKIRPFGTGIRGLIPFDNSCQRRPNVPIPWNSCFIGPCMHGNHVCTRQHGTPSSGDDCSKCFRSIPFWGASIPLHSIGSAVATEKKRCDVINMQRIAGEVVRPNVHLLRMSGENLTVTHLPSTHVPRNSCRHGCGMSVSKEQEKNLPKKEKKCCHQSERLTPPS